MRIIGNDPSTPRQAQIVASGALPSGQPVVVNADGTVSVVEEGPVSQTLGTASVFENSRTSNVSSVYDSVSKKVVIVYQDGNNAGAAVVGSVSGTSVSFGSPTVFASGIGRTAVAYDPNEQKIVAFAVASSLSIEPIAYVGTISGTSISFGTGVVAATRCDYMAATYDAAAQSVVLVFDSYNNSYYGTAVVGAINGTSISFGAPVVFDSSNIAGDDISVVYDSNSEKIVIAYRNATGTRRGRAVVGAVSGTSISFGSRADFSPGLVGNVSSAFDTTSNKVVVSYRDQANSSRGTSIVGTVSGNSISFGASSVFETQSQSVFYTSTTYDEAQNKIVVSYQHYNGSTRFGRLAVGTVTGTSISFGAPVVFESAGVEYTSAIFDSSNKKVVISYRDSGNSNFGTSIVFQNSGVSTNLTEENFIGTAASGAADTQRAKINLKGAVDENQSGLTPGQSYYIQTDGTLDTTPDDPSVFAGTAVAANKLIVKG